MHTFLSTAALALSFGSWLPLWRKAMRTKRTRDYSVLAVSMVLAAQVSNSVLAALEHSPSLLRYFIGNGLLVLFSLLLILRYRNHP